MNHFVETGVLKEYLKDNCSSYNFKLCNYQDQLAWDFIWSKESPLQKTGGWEANKNEYNFIIKDILSEPKYFAALSYKSIEYALKQFFTFAIVIPAPQLAHSAPHDQIKWRFKNNMQEYFSSLQNNSKLDVSYLNFLQRIVVLCSMVVLFVALSNQKILQKIGIEMKITFLILAIHNVSSAFLCANLSTIDDRFQCRLVWLFPFFVIVAFFKFLIDRKTRINS